MADTNASASQVDHVLGSAFTRIASLGDVGYADFAAYIPPLVSLNRQHASGLQPQLLALGHQAGADLKLASVFAVLGGMAMLTVCAAAAKPKGQRNRELADALFLIDVAAAAMPTDAAWQPVPQAKQVVDGCTQTMLALDEPFYNGLALRCHKLREVQQTAMRAAPARDFSALVEKASSAVPIVESAAMQATARLMSTLQARA